MAEFFYFTDGGARRPKISLFSSICLVVALSERADLRAYRQARIDTGRSPPKPFTARWRRNTAVLIGGSLGSADVADRVMLE